MALPVDVRDLYRFGKQITEDRDEPVHLAVFVEVDAAEGLVDAVRDALRPKTAQAHVDVAVIDASSSPLLGADAIVVLAGSAGTDARTFVARARAALTPVVAVGVGDDIGTLDYDLGLPSDDVLSGPDPVALVEEELAAWLADRLGAKRLALGVNFEFARAEVAMEIVKTTAMQNTLIGVVTIIPGTDMPIMTANQVKMLLQLATVYGQRIGADRLGELASVVGGGFALRAVARQALAAVPGFGWVVKGGVAYAGTMAMGRAAIAWFQQGADLNEVAATLKGAARRGADRLPIKVTASETADENAAGSDPVQETLQLGSADAGA